MDVRGNLNSRLSKLDKEPLQHALDGTQSYDALVLATAGLMRLGWNSRISEQFQPEHFGYGVSQGALGIEIRTSLFSQAEQKLFALVKSIQHAASAARCAAERGLLRALKGGCQVPLAVHSAFDAMDASSLRLSATVLSHDGSETVEAFLVGKVNLPAATVTEGGAPCSSKMVSTGLMVQISPELCADANYIAQALELGERLAEKLLKQGADRLLPGFDLEERAATYGSAELAGIAGRQ
jgi:hydroxymethylbilane synthase